MGFQIGAVWQAQHTYFSAVPSTQIKRPYAKV